MHQWNNKLKELEKKGRIRKSKRIGRPKLEVKYYKFVLYGVDFDLNKIIELAKKSPAAYSTFKRKQQEIMTLQLAGLPQIDFKARYVFNWYETNKKKDPGNIGGSQKMVFDALQVAGIIPDDGWNEISEFTHRFFLDSERRLELEIFGL